MVERTCETCEWSIIRPDPCEGCDGENWEHMRHEQLAAKDKRIEELEAENADLRGKVSDLEVALEEAEMEIP